MVLLHGMRGIWRYKPYGRGLRPMVLRARMIWCALGIDSRCAGAYRLIVAMPCLWLRFSLRWCRVGELLGFVAQWIERLSPEQKVVGSTPIKPTGRVSVIRLKPFFHARSPVCICVRMTASCAHASCHVAAPLPPTCHDAFCHDAFCFPNLSCFAMKSDTRRHFATNRPVRCRETA